jgi:hypothetical protein
MRKFRHHKYFPKVKSQHSYLFPFACFGCRKSFKYPPRAEGRFCPQCRKPLEMLSRKFSAPRSRDFMQWQKVELLVSHGFRFYSVYEPSSTGGLRKVKYPDTLAEAKLFVKAFRPRSSGAAA